MIRARLDHPAGGEAQREHRLHSAGEYARHDSGLQPEVLVERQHLDVAGTGFVELAERGAPSARQRDLGRRGEAARLAQVGEHRALVLAVLELPVELRERHHWRVELAGKDLQPARQLRDLHLPALGTPRR